MIFDKYRSPTIKSPKIILPSYYFLGRRSSKVFCFTFIEIADVKLPLEINIKISGIIVFQLAMSIRLFTLLFHFIK